MSVGNVRNAALALRTQLTNAIQLAGQDSKASARVSEGYGPLSYGIQNMVFERVWYPWMVSWQSGYVQDTKDKNKTAYNGLTTPIMLEYLQTDNPLPIFAAYAKSGITQLQATGWRSNPTYVAEVFKILGESMPIVQLFAWAYYNYSKDKYNEIGTADPWLAIQLFSTAWLSGQPSNDSYLAKIYSLIPGPGATLADKIQSSTASFQATELVKLSAKLFAARANYIASATTADTNLRASYISQLVSGDYPKDSIIDLLARCEYALVESIRTPAVQNDKDPARQVQLAAHAASLYQQYKVTTFSFTT